MKTSWMIVEYWDKPGRAIHVRFKSFIVFHVHVHVHQWLMETSIS